MTRSCHTACAEIATIPHRDLSSSSFSVVLSRHRRGGNANLELQGCMSKFAIVPAVALSLILTGCRPEPPLAGDEKPQITIAAAANLTDVLSKITPPFEAETGIHPVLSFASTAQLARQIENSAPFDVFLAADAEHVEELDRKGLLTAGTKAVYAR